VNGAVAVPGRLRYRSWLYVPERTYAICPGCRVSSAFWTVRQGLACVPGFASLPVVET